jgi:hypothetical protein
MNTSPPLSFFSSMSILILRVSSPCGKNSKIFLLWAGILKQSMGTRNLVGIGLSYRPARLHRLAEFIPWNRFLGSINIFKYGLWWQSYHGTKPWLDEVCPFPSTETFSHLNRSTRYSPFNEKKTKLKTHYLWKQGFNRYMHLVAFSQVLDIFCQLLVFPSTRRKNLNPCLPTSTNIWKSLSFAAGA